MKKFSTAVPFLALALLLAAITGSAQAASSCAFRSDAPDQHRVVRGDTLWDIAGKFLEHAWCWPQVWDLNRAQIRDPHWIYPGQIVYLDRAAGRLRLGQPAADGSLDRSVHLTPRIRSHQLDAEAIPAIPVAAIEPFLTQPLISDGEQMKNAPRIVATPEERVYLGKGDQAYVSGALHGATSFQVFRPGKPLLDPLTKTVLGQEAAYLGTVQLQRAGATPDQAHTFLVTESKEEMGVGDWLLPVSAAPLLNYIPHAPATAIDARIVSIYGGVTHAGQSQVVAINRGKADGLDIGSALELYRNGRIVTDRSAQKNLLKLPDQRYGSLFVFRVFPHVSYGLIMQVTDAVQVGDGARSPQ